MKFSIIVPIYNVEKYLNKCLNSIYKQTYNNYEVIMVNDGTKDNSQKIIDKYQKKDKRFKGYIKENGGLSDARNYGLKYVTGDYLIFIDSDDYVEKDYLKMLNQTLIKNKDVEVVKIRFQKVDEYENIIEKELKMKDDGPVSLLELLNLKIYETAWSYVYKISFWKNYNFKYAKGKIHEDFGLTSEILLRANKLYYLNYIAYNYVQRENSIMSSLKAQKSVYDMLEQYDRIVSINFNKSYEEQYLKSFLTNIILKNCNRLNKNDQNSYISELKKMKVYKYLLSDTLLRKLKKTIVKINIKWYLKLYCRG